MKKGSIAASLFWLSAGWLVLALVATGFLLTDLYSRALDTSLSETLEFHVESLAGALLETGDPLSDTIGLTDPRFGRPRSGWYWAIRDDDGQLYNLSTSVVGITLPVAIVVNAFRVFLTGFLVFYVSPEMGEGFMHMSEGWLLFIVAFVILGLMAWVMRLAERKLEERKARKAESNG